MTPRTRIGLAVLLAIAFPTPRVGHAEWWKEPPASRLDQKIVDASGQTAARLRWDDGSIQVRARATTDGPPAPDQADERARALDAARQRAQLKLAEIVEGVTIDGATDVKNAMASEPTVRSAVQARLRGAVVVSETVGDRSDGSAWAEVALELRLRGTGGLTEPVVAWAASRPASPYRPDPGFRVDEPYTGLIVDASDAGFSPALAPRLIEEGSGAVVFGPQMIQFAAMSQQGPAGYAVAISEARQNGRVGANPLIVRATGAAGERRGDLLLAPKDAQRVLAADRGGRFLGRAAVVVVLGKEQRELTVPPGKRHALVIGIDDYPQGSPSGDAKLSYAVRDAQTLAQLLTRAPGFGPDGVTLLENATRDLVIGALRALRARVSDEDSVIVFFAGHGAVGPGGDGRLHHYLLPHDGQLADLAGTALMDDRLEELIGQLPTRQVVVLLDAGYVGGGTGTMRARGLTNPSATPLPKPPIEAGVGRVVISAGTPDHPAFEDDQRGGLFTSFLVEGLRGAADLNGDGAVTVLELYQYVAPRLGDYAWRQYHVEQTPLLEIRGPSGEIVLIRR
ncbi:MAG: hypothetical protein AUH29_12460 [Candidatus Rokubacteria bacterium 13_1_40CM_69_27]|nr:MAG: hypothetical protein AUH29_12460 [Candidatus Rokubacteria bacterium 13_1_40CM_69_27]